MNIPAYILGIYEIFNSLDSGSIIQRVGNILELFKYSSHF